MSDAAEPSPARAAIDAALRRQLEDGHEKFSNRAHWGNTGRDVLSAVNAARSAVTGVPDTGDEAYLQRCVAALRDRHERFRREESDRDGYGSATFAEILREVEAIALANDGRSEVGPEGGKRPWWRRIFR
jgi:hypothetical protein